MKVLKSSLISASSIPEPELLFSGNFPSPDPKTGLCLYGPYSGPKRVTLGIIGDSTTVDQVLKLLEMCRGFVPGDGAYPLWKQDFPGVNPGTAFRCEFVTKPEWCPTITTAQMEEFERIPVRTDRIKKAVDLICHHIENMQEREESPQIFICAPPRSMMDLCIPMEGEGRGGPKGKKTEGERKVSPDAFKPGQKRMWEFSPDVQEVQEKMMLDLVSNNFHHLLKARAMRFKAPTQFVRPYTLAKLFAAEKGPIQDRATVAWNLCTALFYKAEGRPWRLRDPFQGTCFVGIAFYKDKATDHLGTSLAQVFTPEGEGLVIRGDRFRWDPRREPHLTKDGSARLIRKVLDAYKRQTENLPPKRIVVHKTSSFNLDERDGMKSALAEVPRHDFVTIYERARFIKFFRSGYNPPLRGTMITLPDQSRLLYTKGYVPYMRIYPGPRVPRPIEVRFDETDSSRDELCREILGLTRLNWNSADFSGIMPMTLQFAQQVGTILREIPAGIQPESKYLYYM